MKLIIITGINRGLGEAFFNLFINKKDCLIVGISRSISEKQKELLKNEKFIFIKLDLISLSNPKKEIDISKHLNKVTEILYINNAATINPINKIGKFENQEIKDLIQLNTISPILITNYLISIGQNKKITILNISSGAANSPIIGWSLYCASKAANEIFFKTLQLQESDIKVLNIDPGVINSDMQSIIRNTDEEIFPRLKDFIKLKEHNMLKEPKEVAEKILIENNIS